eukprot:20100-Heterococcus_DN1.PRE.3
MRGLDKDCDATINLEEFASRFEVVFTRLNDKLSTTAAAGGVGVVPGGAVLSLEQALVMQRLARLVYKRWHSLEEFASCQHALLYCEVHAAIDQWCGCSDAHTGRSASTAASKQHVV